MVKHGRNGKKLDDFVTYNKKCETQTTVSFSANYTVP